MQSLVFQVGGGVIIKDMVKADGGGIVILPDPPSASPEQQEAPSESYLFGTFLLLAVIVSVTWFKHKNKK